MKIKDLPQPIKELALKRQVEERGLQDENISLFDAFAWMKTIEGHVFWQNIYEENFKPFYDLYPQGVEISKDEFAIGFAEWMFRNSFNEEIDCSLNTKQLLEIYKKEQGL